MAHKILIRVVLFLCGASLLMLTGLVSAARRESVEPYYLEFTIQHMVSGDVAVCRMFYYHQAREACDFQQPYLFSSLSPDGRWRALALADDRGGWSFYRTSPYGSQPREIIHMQGFRSISSFAWSPDGRWLVISAGTGATGLDIFRLQVSSGEMERLTMIEGNEYYAAWSPDGERIAFNGGEAVLMNRLFVMNADGSDLHEVLPGLMEGYRPMWSPDGAWLVFEAGCSQESLLSLGAQLCVRKDTDLYRLRLSDGYIEALAAQPGDEYAAAWSPDGEWIVYSFRNWNATSPQIYRVRPDGSDVQALTNDPDISYIAPTWARTPDFAWHPLVLLTTALVMIGVVWRLKSRFD